ncbi:hypothetical protein HPB51_022432 [Rhipicephalus microplus]|uniref:Uncharacterized protein n=1 Tax=Rhipicephalus microplus TaxID=6941 RepID=A0A9J6DQU1_RHIMP|nr:hypothetical protein HPB51_022432 [Rhipicephalus microplus]
MELVESVSPGPVDNLNGNGQIGGLLNRLNRLLLRDEDALLKELREVLHSTHVDFFQQAVTLTRTQDVLKRAVRDCGLEVAMKEFLAGAYSADMYASIRQACGLERSMADFKSSSSVHVEVELHTTLATPLLQVLQQKKTVSRNKNALKKTYSTLTQFKSDMIAYELHNDIATTMPDDNDNVNEINSANKQKTLLGNALLSLAFKTVIDTADIRLLARANVVELHAARQCATNLALAIQATKELDHFLNYECHNPKDDQWTLPAILAQANLNKASEMRRLCGDSSRKSDAEKSQREQDIVDGVSRVIRELTDGVLGYVADCKASEASEALRDIAGRMRITGH